MSYIQQDLFEVSDTEKLRGEIRVVSKSLDNVRRGIFVRQEELAKRYVELREEMDGVKDAIRLMMSQIHHYESVLLSNEALASGLRSILTPV
jgi:hypothetical protein